MNSENLARIAGTHADGVNVRLSSPNAARYLAGRARRGRRQAVRDHRLGVEGRPGVHREGARVAPRPADHFSTVTVVNLFDLPTPALVIDADVLDQNLATMAAARPGAALRPHVKAHKCTALAAAQHAHGHHSFTCATPREVLGMAAAGLGDDLLLANEVLDPDAPRGARRRTGPGAHHRRGRLGRDGRRRGRGRAARGAGRRERRACPAAAVRPTTPAASPTWPAAAGSTVRGVMGYEGHLMAVDDRDDQRSRVDERDGRLLAAHARVGGDVVSAGGTGTYHLHDRVTEVQAGSYALMDTHYGRFGHPFRQAVHVYGTVISANAEVRRGRRRPEVAGHGPRQPDRRDARRQRRRRVVPERRARHVRPARPASPRGRPGARGARAHRPDDGACTRWRGWCAATRCSTAGPSTCATGDRRH